MVSPEAEALRARVKYVFHATLQPTAPLETRRAQYEAVMSRGELPPTVQVQAVTAGTRPLEWVSAAGAAADRSCCICMVEATSWAPARRIRLLAATLFAGYRLAAPGARLSPGS